MVTVDTIGRIRREHLVGKRSIREISRLLRVSRKVVRQALACAAERNNMVTWGRSWNIAAASIG